MIHGYQELIDNMLNSYLELAVRMGIYCEGNLYRM